MMNDKYLAAFARLSKVIVELDITDAQKGQKLVDAYNMLSNEYERDLRDQYNGKGE